MADFYGRMTATTSKLMAKFRQGVIEYVPLVAGATEYDPMTEGTPIPLDATASGVSKEYVDDLVSASDIQVTGAVFGTTPNMQGRITIDGVSREIIRIKQMPAAGDPVAWVIFVKG